MTQTPAISKLFERALELPAGENRDNWVRENCHDEKLQSDLLQMLRVHQQASGFLSKPVGFNLTSTQVGRKSVFGELKKELNLPDQRPQQFLDQTLPDGNPADLEFPEARYQLHGEIARGGMGAIVKARDVDLGRSLAIKVLLDSHRENDAVVQRFIEEAQIGGQLQHPGIAPVYELGQMPDDRPFFSMKLVKGDTLAAILKERKRIESERGKLLGIFEQICQTMAYAHSRRVIHRDLKPANIMVGSFGEVQVMDWGLAKVMKVGGIADEKRARASNLGQSVIQTVRSGSHSPQASVGTRRGAGSASSDTQAGSVMGTPAYMPPEQALGEVERLDERCDVFGLGAILCEILTGDPPYVSDDGHDLFRQAARGKLDECFARLDRCGADAALRNIVKCCLEPEVEDRTRNARELSTQITEYLESVEQRLRETEVERAAEATRAVEERKRRRITTLLATSAVFLCTLCGAGWMWMQVQAGKRNEAKVAQLNEHLGNARLHQGLAQGENAQKRVSELQKAMKHAEQALELVDRDGLGESQRAEAQSLLDQLEAARKTAEQLVAQQSKDQKLSDRLERIRLGHADTDSESGDTDAVGLKKSATTNAYAEAFREAGIDLATMDEQQIAKVVRDSAISEKLLAGMDHWAASMPRLTYGRLIYAAIATGDWETGIALTQGFLKIDPQSTSAPLDLAVMLVLNGDEAGYEEARRHAIQTHAFPETYLDSERITKACLLLPFKPSNSITVDDLPSESFESALDENRVQPALKAQALLTRGLLAYRSGEYESCLEYLSKSETMIRGESRKMLNPAIRCMAEFRLGREEEARASFEKIDQGLAAANEMPEARRGHDLLYALVLREEAQQLIHNGQKDLTYQQWAKGDVADSDREFIRLYHRRKKLLAVANRVDTNDWSKKVRSAVHLKDTDSLIKLAETEKIYAQQPELISWFASELRRADQPELAVELLRQVVESHPSDYWINTELGTCLNHIGQSEEAIGFHRSALAIRPDNFAAKWKLCLTLELAGQNEASEELFARLLDNENLPVGIYGSLVDNLREQGHYEKAKTIIGKWIEKEPQSDEPLRQMSATHYRLGKIDESVQWADRALEINPDNLFALFRKAWGHAHLEQLPEAEAAYRRYLEIRPDYSGAQNNLAMVVQKLGRVDEAADLYRKAMILDPKNRYAAKNLARLLARQAIDGGGTPASRTELRRLTVRIARDERTAMEEHREQLLESPRDVETRLKLARGLIKAGELDEALVEANRAAHISPDSADSYLVLSEIHQSLGDVDAAIETSQKAIEFGEEDEIDAARVSLACLLFTKAAGREWTLGDDEVVPEDRMSLALIDEAIELLQAIDMTNQKTKQVNMKMRLAPLMLRRLLQMRGRKEEADYIAAPVFESKVLSDAMSVLASGTRVTDDLKELRDRVKPLRDAGKFGEAIPLVQDYIASADEDSLSTQVAWMVLADLYLENSQDEDAIGIWKERAAKENVVGQKALDTLLDYYRSRGQIENIEEIANEAANPVSGAEVRAFQQIQSELAGAYADQGRHQDELRTLRKTSETNRFLPPVKHRYISRRVFELTGDTQEALDHLGSLPAPMTPVIDFEALLLAMDPPDDRKKVWLNQALSLAKQASRRPVSFGSRRRRSQDPMYQLYRAEPDAQWAFSGKNTLGIVHYRRGEYDDALKALTEFHEMKFTEPSNWLFLAMTNWQLGNKDEAREWYAKATEFLDQEKYQPTRMEKLFREEADELIGEEKK